MQTVTVKQMKAIEACADAHGLSYTQLMENAGRAAAQLILTLTDERTAYIFAGKGNNGGDGYVVARVLKENGFSVTAVQVGTPQTADCVKNHALAKESGVVVTDSLPEMQSGVIVDAIYGTGFRPPLSGEVKRIAREINAAGLPVFALDIPSGVNADTGEADPDAVVADVTVCFDSFKVAHVTEGRHLGKLVLADIGILDSWRKEAIQNA